MSEREVIFETNPLFGRYEQRQPGCYIYQQNENSDNQRVRKYVYKSLQHDHNDEFHHLQTKREIVCFKELANNGKDQPRGGAEASAKPTPTIRQWWETVCAYICNLKF